MPKIRLYGTFMSGLQHRHRRAASGGGGEVHTNPVRNPTSAATISSAIIITALAARATGLEGSVQQRTGFQCPADSLHRRGGAAFGIRVAGVILLAEQWRWRRRWQRQHANSGGGGSVGNAATK